MKYFKSSYEIGLSVGNFIGNFFLFWVMYGSFWKALFAGVGTAIIVVPISRCVNKLTGVAPGDTP